MSSFVPIYYGRRICDFAWVDDKDLEAVSRYRWGLCATHAVACRRLVRGIPALRGLTMHRFILGLGRGDGIVHHVNEDGLDNRRENLKHVPSMMAHWEEPHPRWRIACGGRGSELPPHERQVALLAREPA